MNTDIIDRAHQHPVLFDGGMGTELQALGLPIGVAPEGWNIEHPDRVAKVHQAYLSAGAEVLTTNSFGATPHKLASAHITYDPGLINQRAAEIAREVAGKSAWVAGSIGPTGAILMMGEVSDNELSQGFRLQAQSLVKGGADLLIVETMSDLDEALLALHAAKAVSKIPVIVSMTFQAGQRGYRTMMGVDIPSAIKALVDSGADAIGCNCGTGVDDAIHIIAEMRQFTDLPLLAEPNAGLPQLVDGQTLYKESPEIMAEKFPLLISAGAQFVGGCCGTTPAHISAFHQKLQGLRKC